MKKLLLFLSITIYGIVKAQPGSLDNTFSSDGKLTTDIGGSADLGYAVTIQSDGKIVVAGSSYTGSNRDFAVVRYNSNGSLDNTFGTGGKVTTPIGSASDVGYAVVIQSDGKIVVAGSSYIGTNDDFAVVRYNSNGSLDNTFGTGGKVTTAIGATQDWGYSVAMQTDGKIVVAGFAKNATNDDFAVVRYNSNGSLDNTFGTGGQVMTPVGTTHDQGRSVAIQGDGKIVIGGTAGFGASNTYDDFALVRYNSNGSLDNTFGTGGKITTPIGIDNDQGNSVALQSDGKIVLAGTSFSSSHPNDFAVVRYNSNGSYDNSFGTGGLVTTSVGSFWSFRNSVAVQGDGKIVLAGTCISGSNWNFDVVRYSSNGSLDNIFGTNGQVITPVGGADDQGNSVAIQSDGKIVVAGSSYIGSYYDFGVVRYNGTVTGIIEITSVQNFFHIYPNPSINTLYIKNSENKTIDGFLIIDVLGRKVLEQKENTTQINIEGLNRGIYQLLITSEGKNYTSKFIKE